MTDDRQSQLKMYSLGIVVEDKLRGSDYIKASPMEVLPFSNGSLSENTSKYDIKLPDAQGIKRSDKLDGGVSLVAKWIPYGQSNRITAPDVCSGETVVIFSFADTDEYYWTSIFREPSLRKLETVNYSFSDLPGAGTFDKDSSYWLEVSTHDKYVHLHTSKSDGEPFGYDIKLDTATGTLTIDDGVGNTFKLDSASNSAEVITNTSISLKSPVITIDAESVIIKGTLQVDKAITGGEGITVTGIVHGSNI